MTLDEILKQAPDLPVLARCLAERGVVRVDDFFQRPFAERLHHCLCNEVPWTSACGGSGESRTIDHDVYAGMDAASRSELHQKIYAQASDGFAFLYDSYMMIPAYLARRDPQSLLHQMVEILNCAPMLQYLKQITGDATVTKLDAQATRYLPGHFLKFHNDQMDSEGRRFAFVLNLTRRWEADWGGLLQLLDGRHTVVDTLVPRFNSLTLFRVPADHCVSMVTPFARQPRLAITGWLRT